MAGTLQSTASLNGPTITWADEGPIAPGTPASVIPYGQRRFFRVVTP